MKDKQKFINKFNEFFKETSKDYPAEGDMSKLIYPFFDKIIIGWDRHIRDHGVDRLIRLYEKASKKTSKKLIKVQTYVTNTEKLYHKDGSFSLLPRSKDGTPLAPDNAPIVKVFLLSIELKIYGFIIEELKGLRDGKPTSKPRGRPNKETPDLNKPFPDYFSHTLLHEKVIEALVKARLIEPDTYTANERLTGVKFAQIMRVLHKRGYFIDNKKPSADEQVSIAKSAFKLDIKVSSINNAIKVQGGFDYIPKASDLLPNTKE